MATSSYKRKSYISFLAITSVAVTHLNVSTMRYTWAALLLLLLGTWYNPKTGCIISKEERWLARLTDIDGNLWRELLRLDMFQISNILAKG
jgi:hypothetical protein